MRGCLWRHPIKEFLITVSGHPHHCRIVKVLHYNNAGVLHLFSAGSDIFNAEGLHVFSESSDIFNAKVLHVFSASSNI